ncbi:MAG: GNAT family protein [Terracoccus sp.]
MGYPDAPRWIVRGRLWSDLARSRRRARARDRIPRHPGHQGSGYATEAAKACLDPALGPLDAGHVTTIINPENAPSRRVAEKLGMTFEFETMDGQARPIVVYGCGSQPK